MSEVFEALGIPDGAVPIKADEYQALPSHKRGLVSVFIRLPDPPEVAALREIVRLLGDGDVIQEATPDNLRVTCLDVHRRARLALAEFDGSMFDGATS